jgi:hypothetical protein
MFQASYRHALAVLLTLLAVQSGSAQATLGAPIGVSPEAPPPAGAVPSLEAWTPSPMPRPVVGGSSPGRIDPLELYASAYTPHGHGHDADCGPAACIPYEDRNGHLLVGDPLLDGPPGTLGWVVGVELAGVVPHIENRLFAPVTLSNGVIDPSVHLPTSELGGRVMPRIDLGYRFGQAAGELTLAYRFVSADDSQFVAANELPQFAPAGATVKSRLDLQTLDLDYGSYEPSLGPGWDMKWRVGARGIMYYADSQGAGGGLAQQTTNRYWGIGPHAVLEIRRWLGHSGVAVFGRLDASIPFGRLTQRYLETVTAADGTTAGGETRFFLNSEVATIAFQFGLTWSPPETNRLRVTAGYLYEHFYDLGAISTGSSPREELSIQGGFLRAEWNY